MDATNYITRENGAYHFHTATKQDCYIVDFSAVNGLGATGAHTLVNVPKGKAFVGAKLFVLEDCVSSGAAAVKFVVGAAGGLTGNIAKTALSKGKVFDIPAGIAGDYTGFDSGNEVPVKVEVKSAAITALKFLLVVETLDVDAVLNRG